MSTLSFTPTLHFRNRKANHDTRSTGGIVARLGLSLVSAWRTHKAVRAVEALSDASLHDIGLTRGEIDSAVRYGRRPGL